MRLLQLNAWTLRLPTKVTEMISSEAPDIVALQEILESDLEAGLFTFLHELMATVGFEQRFFSSVYAFRFMAGSIDFGNAIISNLNLRDQNTIFTHLTYTKDFRAERDDYNVRNFQHVVAEDKNGKAFHLINHHGYHIPGHKRGNELTRQACQRIFEYTQKLQGPVIIVGDFNLEPESDSLRVFDGYFRNLTTESGLSTTRNSLTHKSEVCDYILVNEQVKVNEFYASNIIASDHLGLILDFDVA